MKRNIKIQGRFQKKKINYWRDYYLRRKTWKELNKYHIDFGKEAKKIGRGEEKNNNEEEDFYFTVREVPLIFERSEQKRKETSNNEENQRNTVRFWKR